MKIRTLILAFVANLVMAGVALAAAELLVEQPNFNFGTIAQGKKVEHNFIIRNTGDAPLQIKQLAASCGCTAATPSASVIQPGKKGEIRVVFDSTNFAGKVQKTVSMVTNAGKTPTSTFVLTGTIMEDLQVSPRQLSLGPLKPGVPKAVNITVANKGNATRRLLSISTTSNSLQIKATIRKSELRPGETTTIDLVIVPRAEARVLSGYLHLVTDHPQKKEITIPIYASPAK